MIVPFLFLSLTCFLMAKIYIVFILLHLWFSCTFGKALSLSGKALLSLETHFFFKTLVDAPAVNQN